jgi:hypothetical protein
MSVHDSTSPGLNFGSYRSELSARKNSIEGIADFRKTEIELAIVELDAQLSQLLNAEDLARVRQIVPKIRDELFVLYNICVHGLDIAEFAGHMSENKTTPLNFGSA